MERSSNFSSVVASQVEEHKLYGGVVPEIASRRHAEAIVPVVRQALEDADCRLSDIDAIGVTYAPGLIGALLVGVNFAKGLSLATGIPLVPVHHLRSHIASNYISKVTIGLLILNLFAVAQTTFQVTKWQESSEFLKKAYTNARIFDTICNATWARQKEAEDLSQKCDIIVVIGGHHSSNTQKLVQVAAKHTRAVTVETASELRPEWFADVKVAGVTAGASTPSSIIEEVLNSMSAEINDSMSFEEMLNASEEKRVHAGSIVKGIVTSISANEIQVDIGAKQTGFVKLSELTDDSSAKVEDLVKVGDELDLIVEKVMDQDGVIQLSRKKLASRKGMEEIAKAAESGEVVEGDVTEFN